MPTGSSMYADADGYQAALQDMLDLLVLRPHAFRARLSWIEFPKLYLARAYESSPRVAFLSLPRNRVFITFPTQRGSSFLAGGAVLRVGDMLWHCAGDRLHQRTTAACHWGYISLSPDSLKDFGRAVLGRDLVPPRASRVLHLAPEHGQRLLRLHAQAGRIADANLALVGHPDVLHSLEQELALALVNCLGSGKSEADHAIHQHQAAMLIEFEALLAEHPHSQIGISDVCNKIGVSKTSFQAACSDLLGMSPGRYQRSRRLKLLRNELVRANPRTNQGADLIRRYGFTNLYQFVAQYWNAYGELPPLPPRRDRTEGE